MIEIEVDLKHFTDRLTDIQQRQIPFATTKALNALAVDFQVAERQHITSAFTLRQPRWIDQSVKITHFAKKAEPWATIAISPPGGAARADILGKFEDDTTKQPFSGAHVAVPVEIRKNKRDIITKANRPKALGLHEEHGQIVGEQGTFLVKLPNGRGLILKRRTMRGAKQAGRRERAIAGPVQRNIVLYYLTPQVPIAPTLRFIPTALDVVERMWAQRMTEALVLALNSAK